MFKQAAIDPAALSALQRGLGWGVGLGVPALATGHALLHDAKQHSADVLRDARNQALLTAAGVGGMQALGDAFKSTPHQPAPSPTMPADLMEATPEKLAAAILVDDVLECACRDLGDDGAKHAALVRLIIHRSEASRLLRSLLP